jgi:hypothetical protein
MRGKWDELRGGRTYGEMTLDKALNGRTEFYDPTRNGKSKPEPAAREHPAADGDDAEADGPNGVVMIQDYFRNLYQPDFRRGTAIHSARGGFVQMNEACAVPDSDLIEQLTTAADAPSYKGGGINRNALPTFFKNWAKVAWGDLLRALPEEDQVPLSGASGGTVAGDEFRRLVTDAMLTEIQLGDVLGADGGARVERRSLIDWCYRFAKPGPWRSIRSKRCWCKTHVLGDGQIVLKVAVRVELFTQIKADRLLCGLGQNTFSRRAERYGVGASTRADRPEGQAAVVLADDFVNDLIAGLPDDDTEAADPGPDALAEG